MIKNLENKSPVGLLKKMIELRNEVYQDGMSIYNRWEPTIKLEDFKYSALNLSFYLALRRQDIRAIQEELIPWGLTSLGSLESRTIATLDAVISTLGKIADVDVGDIKYCNEDNFIAGRVKLMDNSKYIFGKSPKNRYTTIMSPHP